MKAQGKTVVVTGSSGMGRKLVLALFKKGARVAAIDINENRLQETASQAGDARSRLSTHVVNITDREAVLALPDAVIQAHGGIDGQINNAAIIIDGMEKNQYRVLVGQDAKMMDMLCRLMPERAAKLIYDQMRVLLAS